MSIGSRIKEARELKEMSRNKLAELIGVTPSAIANYENGVSSPKLDLMYKLFEALECDANYLFQDEMAELKDVSLNAEERQIIHDFRELKENRKNIFKDKLKELLDEQHVDEHMAKFQLSLFDILDYDQKETLMKQPENAEIITEYSNNSGKKEDTKNIFDLFKSFNMELEAAHANGNATPEENKHDDDIMDNDDEWK